jgi:hypothetical protein
MVEYIRTMALGDYAESDRIEARIDAAGWDGFPMLLNVVFFLAVHRGLGPESSQADIIRFVAEMRAAAPATVPAIDANAAESLIRSALDPDFDPDIDAEMAGAIQALTIVHVLGNGAVPAHELDALLAEATEAANRHLAA